MGRAALKDLITVERSSQRGESELKIRLQAIQKIALEKIV